MDKKSNAKPTFRKGTSYEARDFTDKDFRQVCPILHQWMTSPCDDDGEVRDLVSVNFCVKQGRLKAMIIDPNFNEVAFVTLERFDGCWLKIENSITQDQLEWIKKRKQHDASSEPSRNGMATDRQRSYSENNQNRQ